MNDRRVFSNRTCLALALALAFASGCDANHVLGSEKPDGSTSATAGSGGTAGGAGAALPHDAGVLVLDAPAAEAPSPDDAASRSEVGPLGPVQSWTGYVENYTFPSGSSAIGLTFATDADGNVAGRIVFGDGPGPVPATNPNIGYPPALDNFDAATSRGPDGVEGYIAEGYSYVLGTGTLAASRLHFEVQLYQLWAGWCALQTAATCPPIGPIYDVSTKTCSLPATSTSSATLIDCGKTLLCEQVFAPCACPEIGPCGLNQRWANLSAVTIDVFVTGDTASGSETGVGDGTFNVHFILEDAAARDAGVSDGDGADARE